jgi:hypothetical protein
MVKELPETAPIFGIEKLLDKRSAWNIGKLFAKPFFAAT